MKRDFSQIIVWGSIFVALALGLNAVIVEYNYVEQLNKDNPNVSARKKFDTDNVNNDSTSVR